VDGGIIIEWALLSVAVRYRVIRTAVSHGIADAEEKRRKAARRS
jgi:hypothetical protein